MSRFKFLGISTILAAAFATVTWGQRLQIIDYTASSQQAQRTWDHVWDNSGMSGDSGPGTNVMNDLHDQSVDANFGMWSQGSPPPHTATFDMGQSYELDEFWLWNDNESTWYIQGIKEVTIEIREFGKPFTTVFGPADVPSAQQAGAAASGPDLFVDLTGLTGRFFRITTGAAQDHSHWVDLGGPGFNADAAINEIRLYGDTNGLGNASTEACCFPDGSCTNLLAGDCTTAGGLSEGPGTECATVVCALPEACCFIDGTCADMDPVACVAALGTSEGVGTDCGTFSCPQPASVFAVGDPAVSNGWSSLAGIANITVDSEGGGSEASKMLDGSGITGLLGEYHDKPPGTMWRSTGNLQPAVNQFNAGTVVGSHYAAIEFNKIENLLSVQVWNYNENGKTDWAAQGMKDVTIEVSTSGGGTSNQWTTVFDGALPFAAQFLDYAGTNVPIGGVDAKFVVITSDLGVEGSYMNDFFPQLANTDAGLSELRFLVSEPTSAPPEACCMSDGSCTDLDPGDCNAAGGIAQGVGTTCATTVCPGPEACCFDDGSCTDVLASICTNTVGLVEVGVPQGNGTSCATAACPQQEACCLSDQTCSDLVPSLCTAASGVSQGTGTICAELFCVIVTETVLTNGVEATIADQAFIRYDLEKATSLNPNWTDLAGYVVGDGGQAVLVGPDTDPEAFYRLNIQGPIPAVGNPDPANMWSSLSGIANITVDSFNNGSSDFMLDGSGISGPNGEFHTGDLGNPAGPFTMWRSTGNGQPPVSQFNAGTVVGGHYAAVEFNQIETLKTLQIWNYNEGGGAAWAAQGMKEVTIEYSTTGGPTSNEWTMIFDGQIPFAGQSQLPSFDVPFGDVDARFVVITSDSSLEGNYMNDFYPGLGGEPFGNTDAGLSELRFLLSDNPAIIPIDTVAVNDPTGFSFSSASGTTYELERAFKFPPEPIGGAGISNGWDQTSAIMNVVASSEETGVFNGTAVQTVNGAGVSADGSAHGEVATDNIFWWTQAAGAPARGGTVTGEQWVEYQLDQVYTLGSIQIWNYNEAGSDLTQYGISNATIQVSTTGSGDPGDWTTVFSGTIPEAGGSATEPVSLEVNAGNTPAKHVVITAHSHHGDPFTLGSQVQGLSEVRLQVERTVPISVPDAEFAGTGAFTVGDGGPQSLFDPNGFSTDYYYRIVPQ
jgi:hypothetical protein